jgi:hypothetical protein
MSEHGYENEKTALLLIDPYSDFLSEAGKLWPRVKDVATEVGLLDNLEGITRVVRRNGIQIFIVPHRRWEPGDYETWHYPSPTQIAIMKRHSFARGEWGGDCILTSPQGTAISSSRSTGGRAGLPIPT